MAGKSSFLTTCVSARELRRLSVAALICTAFALGACGDDDEGRVQQETAPSSTSTTTTGTDTAPATTETETAPDEVETESEGSSGTGGASPGEEQEGGAGDEVAASSQALVTGRGGKLSPRLIRVPPFIAIRVELRSADGGEYELRGGGKSVSAGGEIASASTTFDGLRPGKRLVLTGPSGRVVVEASAEPGP
jgi:hypothetical protein